jgi:superfamily II DNA or RNA helicase
MRGLLAFTDAKRRALRSLLERHRLSRTLVFTADNATAYAIAREHLVMPLTCDIGRRERDDALERFRRGHIRTLVSARVLNEGLDVPDADVAVVVGGALGEREHVQRVGRLLRPGEGKRALVYELVTRDTIEVGQARRRRQGLVARRSPQL